jgi:hypothetical protein
MAAGATYTPIATTTGTGSSGTISFTSIPSTYTDLVLIQTGASSSASATLQMTFNGDTATNYSRTYIIGNGSGAVSGRDTSIASVYLGLVEANTNTIVQIQNYANTTTYKTCLARTNVINTFTGAVVGLWRSTAAINRIDVFVSSATWNTTSTFTLYGIAAA